MLKFSWILSTTPLLLLLLLFFSAEVSKSSPISDHNREGENVGMSLEGREFIQNLTRQLSRLRKLTQSHRQTRQRDDEDGESGGGLELPEIVPEILKIVGSALAGNASALIDNSISLLPEGVSNTISGALNVLVNTINNARPTKPTKRTTTPTLQTTPETKMATSADGLSTSQSSSKTTDEDEEDYEGEDKTSTNPTDLRTNVSSSTVGVITSTPVLPLSLNLTQVNESLIASQVTPTLSPGENSEEISIASVVIDPSVQDQDNKANWISLIGQNVTQSSPLDEIDTDNKANWESLLGPPLPLPPSSSVQIASGPSPSQGLFVDPKVRGNSSDDIAALIVASIIKVNQEQSLPKMRDNSKAPGVKILSPVRPTAPLILSSGNPPALFITAATPGQQIDKLLMTTPEPTTISLREKLMILLQAQSNNSSSNDPSSLTTDLTSQLLQVIKKHSSGNDQVSVDKRGDGTNVGIIISNSSGSVNGVPLYGHNYASGFIHSSGIQVTTLTPIPDTSQSTSTTTEDEDEDEDEDSRKL